MKLIIDENISFGKEAFGEFGETMLVNGRKITNELLRDAEILIIRSITKVDENLLKDTKVKFVGTATIGTDHIDKAYLGKNKIAFADAAGCNSYAVAEYVFAAILKIFAKNKIKFTDKSIGIIGVGNIGSKVKKISDALGLKVILNDPPLKRKTGSSEFASLEETLSADIVTFHVPLNKTGIDKTYHLLNDNNIGLLKKGTLLINSSRGPVVNNNALLKKLKKQNDIFTVLDVWENEPAINSELLELASLATPHIAGYSLEGKVNGTVMVYEKLCRFLNKKPSWKPAYPEVQNNVIDIDSENSYQEMLEKIFSRVYDIENDNSKLKSSLNLAEEERPKYFDLLRKEYPYRRELNNYFVKINSYSEKVKNIFNQLRLKLLE